MASKINIGASISLDGEKTYRESLKNITSEQKLLTSEMKLASAQYSQNANSLEALQAKNQVLSKQIDNQTDKVKLYARAVDDSTEKQKKSADQVEKYKKELAQAEKEMDDMKKTSNTTTDAIEKQEKAITDLQKKLQLSETAYSKTEQATNSYKTSLNLAEAQLEKMNTELNQNDVYLKEASQSATKTANSIDNMGKQVNQTKSEVALLGDTLKSGLSGASVIAGVTALAYAFQTVSTKVIDLSVSAAKYADDMLTMSTVTGINTDKLQAYNYMAELTDTSMETIEKTMVKNIRSMSSAQQGTQTYVDAYKRLNVEFEDGNGKLKDSETVYWQLIDALGQIGSETERDAISLTLFGKSAQDLNPLIQQGSQGVAKFTAEAQKMGAVLDNDTLQKLAKTDDSIQRFIQSTEILKRKAGAELSDELVRSMDKISEAMEDNSDKAIELAEGGIELITDGFTWMIDNSDIIIAGLAGIGGAMAMKKGILAVTTAIDLYKGFSTALKTATISQEALNVAQASNPVGLILTAIAGITTALITYSAVTDKATSDTDALIESSKEMNKNLDESANKRAENIQNMQAEAGYMQSLGQELTTLNDKEVLSNSEKLRMTQIVQKLNAELPNLNLSIDEQTGKLNGNTQAIKQSIDANLQWYKVQAAKEELTELLKEQAEAELEVYKIDQQIAKENDKIAKSTEEKAKITEEALENGTIGTNKYAGALRELNRDQEESEISVLKLTDARKEFTGVSEEQSDQIDVLTSFIKDNTIVTEENAAVVGQATTVYTVYGEAITTTNEDVKASIDGLNEKFNEAKESASDSLMSQVGLFEEAAEQSSISVSEMATNLQSQTDAFNKYKDDIIAASGLVQAGLMDQGLLGYIESFGMQGAASLNELVEAASTDKDSFNALMAEWTEMQEAKDGVTTSMAEIETNYSQGMQNLGVTFESGNQTVEQGLGKFGENVKKSSDETKEKAVTTYRDMVAGLSTSINTKAPMVSQAAGDLATKTITTLNTSLGMAGGQSMKARTVGIGIAEGMAAGITAGSGKVTTAIQNLVNNAISKADFSSVKSKIDKALGDALD